MRRSFPTPTLFAAVLLVLLPGRAAQAQQGNDTIRARDGTPIPVIPRAPEGMAEGAVWIPPMPPLEATLPPEAWEPVGYEQPPMPYILLRLPRTNITRARFPAIDFHVHARELTTPEAYESLIALMDSIGMGAIINLNGGTGAHLDSTLAVGEAYRDRVVNFVTLNLDGINEPGWSEWMAGEMERGFLAGARGLKVAKSLGQGARNPDGTFIQADDPRLDAVWAMAAKYDMPVMIHTSDSVGRFYPIGPLNERYEAGLWRHPGNTSGNLYASGPPREVIEQAREKMLAKHPRTRFVLGHMAMLYYDPGRLGTLLDTYPNADLETSAARPGSGGSSSSSTRTASSSAPMATSDARSTTSGLPIGASWRPSTSTSIIRPRSAPTAARRATGVTTSTGSAFRTKCCARSTSRTRSGIFPTCAIPSSVSSQSGAGELTSGEGLRPGNAPASR